MFRFTSRTSVEIEEDIGDEIAFHVEMQVRDLVDAGWSPDAARAEARRRFGDVRTTATYCRAMDIEKESRMRFRVLWDEFRQDLTYGIRTLVRQRGLTALAGYRGKPKGDLEALAHAVVAISQLAEDAGVAEAEINPLIVRPAGEGVVAVDALVRLMV